MPGGAGGGRAPRHTSVLRAAACEVGASATPERLGLVFPPLWEVAWGRVAADLGNLEECLGLCDFFLFKVK